MIDLIKDQWAAKDDGSKMVEVVNYIMLYYKGSQLVNMTAHTLITWCLRMATLALASIIFIFIILLLLLAGGGDKLLL